MVVILTKEKTNKLIAFWVKGSVENLKNARSIFERSKINTFALFMIHLSIEKALKGVYVKMFEKHAPYTHNLLALFEGLDSTAEELIKYNHYLSDVTEFNIEARYPSYTLKLHKKATRQFVTTHIKKADEFIKWIFKKYDIKP